MQWYGAVDVGESGACSVSGQPHYAIPHVKLSGDSKLKPLGVPWLSRQLRIGPVQLPDAFDWVPRQMSHRSLRQRPRQRCLSQERHIFKQVRDRIDLGKAGLPTRKRRLMYGRVLT